VDRLVNLTYQGNIRELENIVKRMIILDDPGFSRITLPREGVDANENGDRPCAQAPPRSLKSIVREAALRAERQAICRVLEQTHWNRGQAAKLLNVSYRGLLYKIKHAGLEPKRSSARSSP
jgi:two-component system, NtrC family, response regulator AtoC